MEEVVNIKCDITALARAFEGEYKSLEFAVSTCKENIPSIAEGSAVTVALPPIYGDGGLCANFLANAKRKCDAEHAEQGTSINWEKYKYLPAPSKGTTLTVVEAVKIKTNGLNEMSAGGNVPPEHRYCPEVYTCAMAVFDAWLTGVFWAATAQKAGPITLKLPAGGTEAIKDYAKGASEIKFDYTPANNPQAVQDEVTQLAAENQQISAGGTASSQSQ
jgi:hypothetical protein